MYICASMKVTRTGNPGNPSINRNLYQNPRHDHQAEQEEDHQAHHPPGGMKERLGQSRRDKKEEIEKEREAEREIREMAKGKDTDRERGQQRLLKGAPVKGSPEARSSGECLSTKSFKAETPSHTERANANPKITPAPAEQERISGY